MTNVQQSEATRLYKLVYGNIVDRCWFEVRKLWLEYTTFSTMCILYKVCDMFWQDKCQDKYRNLSHIHSLVVLVKEDMDNKAM